MFLLDTNILSDMIRNPLGRPAQMVLARGVERVRTSIVVAGELRWGAEKKGSERLARRVEALLDEIAVLPLGSPADAEYARLRARLESGGVVIGGNDMLIAAHALAEDMTLVTDNTAEFSRIEGLSIENWLR